jgi:hypothetical protein
MLVGKTGGERKFVKVSHRLLENIKMILERNKL